MQQRLWAGAKAEACEGALLGLIPLVLGQLSPGYSASMSLQRVPVYKIAPDNQLPEDRVPFVFLTVVSSVLTSRTWDLVHTQ